MCKVSKCVTLRVAPIVRNFLVSTREGNRLESQEYNLARIVTSKLDNTTNLLVVDAVN